MLELFFRAFDRFYLIRVIVLFYWMNSGPNPFSFAKNYRPDYLTGVNTQLLSMLVEEQVNWKKL